MSNGSPYGNWRRDSNDKLDFFFLALVVGLGGGGIVWEILKVIL